MIEMKQIGWVVASFECREALPGPARIRGPDARLALVAEEVDVDTFVVLLQDLGKLSCPRLVCRLFLRVLIKCSDVDHDS